MTLRMSGAVFAALMALSVVPAPAAPPPGQAHTTYDIVVNRAGDRVRGSPGTSSFNAQLGTVIAEFPVPVTNCIYVATLGRGTRDGGNDEKPGFITVVRSSGFANGVFVQMFGPHNRPRNRPFHLVVAC
jgi:hypothetical protein